MRPQVAAHVAQAAVREGLASRPVPPDAHKLRVLVRQVPGPPGPLSAMKRRAPPLPPQRVGPSPRSLKMRCSDMPAPCPRPAPAEPSAEGPARPAGPLAPPPGPPPPPPPPFPSKGRTDSRSAASRGGPVARRTPRRAGPCEPTPSAALRGGRANQPGRAVR